MTSRDLRLGALLALLAATACGGACATAHAKSAADGPPLDIPKPPPRVIAAIEEPPAPPIEEPPAPAPPPSRPTTAPPRSAPRPEPRVDSAVPSAPPADARPSEPRTLRAPGEDPGERAIRDRLATANRDLARVNYARLSAGGRAQYDQSKRFIQQAEQALKDRNLVFASTLADKAAALAAELAR